MPQFTVGVTDADGLGEAVSGVSAAADVFPGSTRIVATNFLYYLSGDGTGGETEDTVDSEEAATKRKLAAAIMSRLKGRTGQHPKLALVVEFLRSPDVVGQK